MEKRWPIKTIQAQRERSTGTCYNMDEPQTLQWVKEARIKGHTSYDMSRTRKFRDSKQACGCQELRWGMGLAES